MEEKGRVVITRSKMNAAQTTKLGGAAEVSSFEEVAFMEPCLHPLMTLE